MEQADTNQSLEVCIVLCTCPDGGTARQLSRGLVETRMAACVNIVPNITSVFRWQGEIQDETEFLLIAKTTRSRFGALETWLQANHPYDMPEILMVPTVAGLEAYMTWVREETRQT